MVKQTTAISWADVGSERQGELIQRSLAGDEEASAELVAEHHRMVLALASHMLQDREDALEVTQNVFLQVFRTLHQFRGQSTLRTWIYRIAVNQIRNQQRWWRRRRAPERTSLQSHIEEHGEWCLSTNHLAPDRLYARQDLGRRLREALERLSFEQRAVIILREIEGLSYADIGYSLGLAVGTVKSKLARARRALRDELRHLR